MPLERPFFNIIKGGDKQGNIVAQTLLLMTFPCARKRETFVADTKYFLTKSETFFVSATNAARACKQGKVCVGCNVSATMCSCLPGP